MESPETALNRRLRAEQNCTPTTAMTNPLQIVITKTSRGTYKIAQMNAKCVLDSIECSFHEASVVVANLMLELVSAND